MAIAGDKLEHPVTGERTVFLKRARDTSVELLQLDFFMKGGGFEAAEHVHPNQEERFEVLSGTARFRVRGGMCLALTGDRAGCYPPSWARP